MKEKKLTTTERIQTAIRMLMYLCDEIEINQPKKEHLIWFINSIINLLKF